MAPSRPSAEQALEALRLVATYFGFGRMEAEVYDQDARPPGACSRDAFLRLHRSRVRARTPGWSVLGKRRLVSGEAWALEMEGDTARARTRTSPKLVAVVGGGGRNIDDDLNRQLGIRTGRATR